jgi:hypothetical protein
MYGCNKQPAGWQHQWHGITPNHKKIIFTEKAITHNMCFLIRFFFASLFHPKFAIGNSGKICACNSGSDLMYVKIQSKTYQARISQTHWSVLRVVTFFSERERGNNPNIWWAHTFFNQKNSQRSGRMIFSSTTGWCGLTIRFPFQQTRMNTKKKFTINQYKVRRTKKRNFYLLPTPNEWKQFLQQL